MFTLAQIEEIHGRLGKAGTLPDYLQALREIGVETYDSYLGDGHSEYFGAGGHKLLSSPAHDAVPVAATADRAQLRQQLDLHQQGATSYLEMSEALATAGVEKWTFDTAARTLTYYDRAGTELLREQL